ncbi:hypothetical protein SELMODRAFT_406066 [Selaginella moellendorffii]|uniref:Cyanovirin-N domain-containing protein n=1 Tax=Selaginella moellendorffii TaxID=88036 RepID=D8R0K1_SELML|nr:uncharacterized protein LOC9654121 [Selaginella moellendorffii]EFJ34596.1 hypothetical protein SELMODRAFT_406066 [Selaginella moellendorffii]|eukprot:XP_002964263.1 uncharacterized protein LOC9654121 [Selaginella moellendorffii]
MGPIFCWRYQFALLPLMFISLAKSCGFFSLTCNQTYMSFSFLYSKCLPNPRVWTYLPLNPHIGNENGVMVVGEGFARSCGRFEMVEIEQTSIKIRGVLGAVCRNRSNVLLTTAFDLDQHVDNTAGKLTWCY